MCGVMIHEDCRFGRKVRRVEHVEVDASGWRWGEDEVELGAERCGIEDTLGVLGVVFTC